MAQTPPKVGLTSLGSGLNAQIASLAQQTGAAAHDQIQQIASASGAPYQSKHLTTRQAYARLQAWHTPNPQMAPVIQKQVAAMSLPQVAQAALEAVQLHKRAVQAGIVTSDQPAFPQNLGVIPAPAAPAAPTAPTAPASPPVPPTPGMS